MQGQVHHPEIAHGFFTARQAGNNDIAPGLSFNIIFGINAGPAVEVAGSPAKPLIHSNLKHLYGVARAPCDTALREPIPARPLFPFLPAIPAKSGIRSSK